jgi:hypothetical protein
MSDSGIAAVLLLERILNPSVPRAEKLDGLTTLMEYNRLLERVLEFSSSTQSDGWHLDVCRMERRGDPKGLCIEECAALRARRSPDE